MRCSIVCLYYIVYDIVYRIPKYAVILLRPFEESCVHVHEQLHADMCT